MESNPLTYFCRNAGSDYMSYTQLGYPAAFAAEGNPVKGGFPGDFDPYVHGVNDTMDVDDETGFFSLDVSLISVSFF
jgi:leucyl aminopeptidase